MNKRPMKPYVAIILVILYGLDIFWLSGKIVWNMGEWGVLFYEGLLVLIAVAIAFVFRADLKRVFPFKKPKLAKTAGTLVFWMGSFFAAMIPSSIMLYVFPQKMAEASGGVNSMASGVTLAAAVILVCVTPAVCEEMAFRGAMFSAFREMRSPWVGILVVSFVFGAFHGSIWRFVPTAILGVGMGYLLVVTDNMFYNMFFHLVNNLVPVLLIQFLFGAGQGIGIDTGAAYTAGQVPLATVGIYMLYGSSAPFLLYAGDYLLRKGQAGYRDGFLPRRKKADFLALMLFSGGLAALGICILVVSMAVDGSLLYGM